MLDINLDRSAFFNSINELRSYLFEIGAYDSFVRDMLDKECLK